jgi:hypothetical protein
MSEFQIEWFKYVSMVFLELLACGRTFRTLVYRLWSPQFATSKNNICNI